MRVITVLALVLVLATSAMAFEKKAYQMREDFGTEPLYTSWLQYSYYIPCPSTSWFWAYQGWAANDQIGIFYTIGDPSMYVAGSNCVSPTSDPCNEVSIEYFRILDFAGYGTIYPGLYTVEFDIYCADAQGCPVGPSLWNSGPREFCTAGWNYIYFTEPFCVTECATDGFCYPRILLTAKMIGSDPVYPAWGMDNISSAETDVDNCAMHDGGCCPALYPRPYNSHYPTMHSGFYGVNWAYCPPAWFLDGADSSADGSVWGFIELPWRLYLANSGPTATEPSTWGNIKAMYR